MRNKLEKVTITRNGQRVVCYGKWKWDSSAFCYFEDNNLNAAWSDGADNWTEAVKELTAYAKREGTRLVQLEII